MSESNNVKFLEVDGKWMYKQFDAEGSVVYRSDFFETEAAARDHAAANVGHGEANSAPAQEATPEEAAGDSVAANPSEVNQPETGTTAPEGDLNAGDASQEGGADLV